MSIRIWILIIALFLSLLAIAPWHLAENGVVIKSVDRNSSEFDAGLKQGMIIEKINGEKVSNIADYSRVILGIFNAQSNDIKLTVLTKSGQEIIFLTDKAPIITVGDISKTNIKTGLDLSGGARALVKPVDVVISQDELDNLIAVTNERFNVYGISDINVRPVTDLSGNKFMLVEVAGATPSDLKNLISQQGKFESKVANTTVFEGGERDIADVCRNDAKCAGINSCFQTQGGYACNFRFAVYLTETAAKKHADVTGNISLDSTGKYLSEKLYLYIDDKEADSLYIGAELKGKVTTEISIQGTGTGITQEEAFNDAKYSMNKLQTILITGSLPYKLEIVKLDTISPVLGKEFTRNIMILGLLVFAIISVILFVKYRNFKITLPVILTMLSEAVITLAIAAFIKWNLDAPSIAGIIAGIGTGVNDQIIIIDESVSNKTMSVKERIKRALFIIFGAFFTIVAALIPLYWAGAGLLKGFAITTIIGITVGILITRPAFADIIKRLDL